MQDAFLKVWERGTGSSRSPIPGVPVPRDAQRVPEADAHRHAGRAPACLTLPTAAWI